MSLLSRLQALTDITHRRKNTKPVFFESRMNNIYKNGVWYINEYGTVKDQHELPTIVNGNNQCSLMYTVYGSGGQYRFMTTLYTPTWKPKYYHNSQQATFKHYTSNGSLLNTTTVSLSTTSSPSSYMEMSSSSSNIPTNVKNGILEVSIPSYYDSTNDIFYTGVSYYCVFSNLTTSAQGFNVDWGAL